MTPEVIIWGLAFVILTIIEIQTIQFVSIWLALSALVTMFLAIANIAFWQQILIFVVISTILLLLTRPIAKKLNATKKVETNGKLDIGKSAIVIEEIDTLQTRGRVTLNGVDWTARSSDATFIPVGTTVKVENIDGSKLIVHV